ncbi:hypothetical protein RGR602_PB00147 (plasmid) [Rhizobium gallicum bv. gallicum R602sp]|uniref:Uncharacterized protein n=3 Tax=Rhizobium TaxID=379 RepID=A0A0B4XA92_9HYPH|nr:hypothetical protein RGR602_PB00147 [Rhizobium gallicum bv. gallicum R602sp]MBB4276513.1 hypothetical protein [Rhizobium mongolense]TCU33042.1 hypothetical protein EV129_11739 [Rhizobium azibense]TDW34170.1 hypothetical protein EV128_104177 [Rhizobium azibense]
MLSWSVRTSARAENAQRPSGQITNRLVHSDLMVLDEWLSTVQLVEGRNRPIAANPRPEVNAAAAEEQASRRKQRVGVHAAHRLNSPLGVECRSDVTVPAASARSPVPVVSSEGYSSATCACARVEELPTPIFCSRWVRRKRARRPIGSISRIATEEQMSLYGLEMADRIEMSTAVRNSMRSRAQQ